MKTPKKITKIAIFNLGTWSTSKTSEHRIGQAASYFMRNERDFILQLYQNCEENKLLLEGAGTDIVDGATWSVRSLFNTVAGGIDGHFGNYGFYTQLEKIKEFIRDQAKNLTENEWLEISAAGWSRGGFLVVLLFKTIIPELIQEGIRIHTLRLVGVDPVLGGTDRVQNFMNTLSRLQHYSDPQINIFTDAYYSDTGNLNIWDNAAEYVKNLYQMNIPFFSGVLDSTKNKKMLSKNGDLFEHSSNRYIVPANHEGVNGRCRNKDEQCVFDILAGSVLRASALKYKESWQNQILENEAKAIEVTKDKSIPLKLHRKFLQPENLINGVLPRTIKESDRMLSILDLKLFHQDQETEQASHKLKS